MKIILDVSATLLRAEQTLQSFYSSIKLRLIAIYPTHKKD